MNLILLLAGGSLFVYALIRKPEIIAIVLFTLIIARINFDLKGLPLNLRALMSLALFGRIISDKSAKFEYPAFIRVPGVKVLIIFLVYILFIAFSQDLFTMDLLKENISVVLTAFSVYYFFFKHQNANHLKAAIIASGLICFADLAYTYSVYGSFPIHRIYNLVSGVDEDSLDIDLDMLNNWNFFGQICGMCFVFTLTDFIKNKAAGKLSLWILPIMLLGVLMSTSRSSILALLIISILAILSSVNLREQKKRIARLGSFSIGVGLLGFLLFVTFAKYVNLDSKFVDEIGNRLAQEPIAILNRAMGQSYDINNLGSMDWREESSENAYKAYINLSFPEQLLGIGNGGFEARNIGQGYNAHNAVLLMLIENGVVGFIIYIILVGGTIFQCIAKRNFSPSLATVSFTLIYGLGQNREWSNITNLLFVVCMIAELELIRIKTFPARRRDHPDEPEYNLLNQSGNL